MSQLELDDKEWATLADVLRSSLSELRNEVSHTDRQSYRQQLKEQEHLLRQILGKLERPA